MDYSHSAWTQILCLNRIIPYKVSTCLTNGKKASLGSFTHLRTVGCGRSPASHPCIAPSEHCPSRISPPGRSPQPGLQMTPTCVTSHFSSPYQLWSQNRRTGCAISVCLICLLQKMKLISYSICQQQQRITRKIPCFFSHLQNYHDSFPYISTTIPSR